MDRVSVPIPKENTEGVSEGTSDHSKTYSQQSKTPNPEAPYLAPWASDGIIWDPKGLSNPASLALPCAAHTAHLQEASVGAFVFLQ